MSDQNTDTALNVVQDALEEIFDNALRLLNSRANSPNITTERAFPIQGPDFSLINDNMDTRSPTRTDVAGPSTRSLPHASPRVIREEPEEEAQELRNNLSEQSGSSPTAPQIHRRPMHPMENMMLHDLLFEIRELRFQLGNRHEAQPPPRETARNTRQPTNHALDLSYGHSPRDVRHRHGTNTYNLSLKEARNMIPEINGTSRERVREFLNASSYAMKNIHPSDEFILLDAILCTKFKGKAMMDFHTRDIENYDQLKRELENEYLGKRSTAHLQLEFNSLKQKSNETAQEFGRRVDNLAMELYESMEEGKNHTIEQQRAILESIKEQALYNYQIGLHEEIKLLVRAQRYNTLQEAIAGASAEEKVKGASTRLNGNRRDMPNAQRNNRAPTIRCGKCGKIGHDGRDCRSSRYANRFELPRPEGRPRVNTAVQQCSYCKKTGHSRNDCWTLHGRPPPKDEDRPEAKPKRKIEKDAKQRTSKAVKMIKHADTASSDESSDDDSSTTGTAAAYQVTHVKRDAHKDSGLDLVTLSIRETKSGKIDMLFDSGATLSLIKVKNLKGETKIRHERIALVGITGHKVYTIGKIQATIELGKHKIKHPIYVVKDDFPLEYDGILGLDFLRKQQVTCDYNQKKLTIRDVTLKFKSYQQTVLKPRSETIVRAVTNRNKTGVVRAQEPAPGVYIGRCLVKPKNFSCPISVINTTDKTIRINTPVVTVEDLSEKNPHEVYTVVAEPKNKSHLPRKERI